MLFRRLRRGSAALLLVLTALAALAPPAFAAGSLTIGNAAVIEGTGAGTTNLVFTVTASAVDDENVTFDYATESGSATEGEDFTETSASGTILAGQTTTTVTVPITRDALPEPNETFTVVLSNPSTGTSVADDEATGTITNDDGLAPSFSVDDPDVTEIDSPDSNTLEFTVTLSTAVDQETTVDYTTTGGTATSGVDYAPVSSTLTFAANDTSETVIVPVAGDDIDEADETVVLTLSAPTNATVSDASGTGTIEDDDAEPVILVDDVSDGESTGPLEFVLNLSGPSGRTVTVDFDTSNGTASSGDYTATSGTATFAPGDTSEIVSVPIVPDALTEEDETVILTLTSPGNADVEDATAVGTIVDDETNPTLSIGDLSVAEGNAGSAVANLTVTLSAPSEETVTVNVDDNLGASTATAGTDYDAFAPTLVTFAPGDTSETVAITVNGDVLDEPNETAIFELSGADNAAVADSSGTLTITDDDATPTLSVADIAFPEGDTGTTTPNVVVTLSAVTSQAVTVSATTTDVSATSGEDYTPQVATLVTIPAGETTANLPVTIFGDELDEANETFTVTLSGATNADIGDGEATVTITDDDDGPGISVSDETTAEGTGAGTTTLTFEITLSEVSGQTVMVDYTTQDGSAQAGEDYGTESGTAVFDPGDTTETVIVTVVRDSVPEPTESFTLELSDADNGEISDDSGTGTITNDDGPARTLSVGDVLVDEANDATITVTASGTSALPMSVVVTTTPGTTTAPADYATTTATVTIPAGQLTGTTTVPIVHDSIDEPPQSFTVTLSDPHNATINDGTGLVTITDDDNTPSISIADTFVLENAGPAQLTISLSNASSADVTLHVTTFGGNATPDAVVGIPTGDYEPLTDELVTIPAGQTSIQVPVPVHNDVLVEGDENFQVGLSTPVGGTFDGGDSLGNVAIVDDETPSVITIDDVAVSEATDPATVTLHRTGSVGGAVSVTVNTGGGNATTPADYDDVVDGTATFAPGSSTATVNVGINEDLLDEANETFVVTLTNPTNGGTFVGGDSTATVTINDNDATPSLSINDVTVIEGDGGTTNASFTVTLSAASGQAVSAQATLSDGTTNASDRTAVNTPVSFVAGDTTETVIVPIIGDTKPEANETYSVTLSTAVNATISDATGAGVITDDDGGGTYTPVGPTRIVDTRSGLGRPGTAKVPAGTNVQFDVTGVGGVPSTGVSSVVLNVTITQPTAAGFAAVTPSGFSGTSNVNFAASENVANLVVVPVGANGNIRFASSTPTHVVMDVAGWFADDTSTTPGSHLTNVTPARVLDSRNGTGGPTGKLSAGTTRVLDVTGVGGVPASGVRAVILNVTVFQPTAASFLSVTPNGGSTTSSVNFNAGETAAGLVIVPVGAGGSVRYTVGAGSTHVIADVFGWFSNPGTVTGSVLRPLTPANPTRLMDTRTGTGTGGATSKVGPGQTRVLQITGRAGIPAGAASVVLNATVTQPTAPSFLSVTPNGGSTTSNLNFTAGQTVANLTIVPIGGGGGIRLRNSTGSTHVIGDAFAYFSAPAT